ncbi:hypothetical protein IQ266_23145 [filamentous cyanobacterium LEGE 11480]|uniref:SGNH hydrolase-type esterase domain-containing protein n=1 Tax=Romeriopsis navalis LEGE 11480 TaxID=2777977 RepID=A0A928VPZ9_9CYAN|nr:hypothetical protein [Romeriopsis navalis]MBE9032638.1 hypothetical protein [Romeriopsis navalis LEGE 11480]
MVQVKHLSISLLVLTGLAQSTVAQDKVFQPNPNQPVPNRPLPADVFKSFDPAQKTVNLSVWEIRRSSTIQPKLDWEMPARYGLDQNKNGTIDLPNSIDYVMNRRSPVNQAGCKSQREAEFTVKFTSKASTLPKYRVQRKSPIQLNAEKAALVKRGVKVNLDLKPPSVPKINYSWKVERGGRTYISRDRNPTFCLPEGNYKVSLGMRQGKQARSITQTVPVIDYLIVLLGDSYGAGEGAPERLFKIPATIRSKTGKVHKLNGFPYQANRVSPRQIRLFTHWADHGLPLTQRGFSINYGDPRKGGIAKIFRHPDVRKMWGEPKNRMYVEHQLAHRSSYTHASQLAMRLEKSDQRSSVTFINLAQSGATIRKGVLGAYKGVENEPLLKGGRTMRPQMSQLETLLRQRSADDLFMSIGGNDMGFANIIALLMLSADQDVLLPHPPPLSILSGISHSFSTGKWSSIGHPIARSAIEDANGKIHDVAGVNGVGKDYAKLNGRLNQLRQNGKLLGDVHLIGPPFFGSVDTAAAKQLRLLGPSSATGITHTKQPATLFCQVELRATIIERFNTISALEFRWAKQNLLSTLSGAMQTAARANQWKFVRPGIEPFKHGLCGQAPNAWYRYNPSRTIQGNQLHRSGVRWFRTPEDGAALQVGDIQKNKGMFHPNELGYLHLSRQLEKALGPNPIKNRGNRPPHAQPWQLRE